MITGNGSASTNLGTGGLAREQLRRRRVGAFSLTSPAVIIPGLRANVKPSTNGYNQGLSQLVDQCHHFRALYPWDWRHIAIKIELEKSIP